TDTGIRVQLRQPLRGVAPGQAIVLYRPEEAGDLVLGSGIISAAS
ncbi:MAG: aminomethyltransferase beta-barrel domain-containing protein, partial [Saccharopolyspora rectivirgula]